MLQAAGPVRPLVVTPAVHSPGLDEEHRHHGEFMQAIYLSRSDDPADRERAKELLLGCIERYPDYENNLRRLNTVLEGNSEKLRLLLQELYGRHPQSMTLMKFYLVSVVNDRQTLTGFDKEVARIREVPFAQQDEMGIFLQLKYAVDVKDLDNGRALLKQVMAEPKWLEKLSWLNMLFPIAWSLDDLPNARKLCDKIMTHESLPTLTREQLEFTVRFLLKSDQAGKVGNFALLLYSKDMLERLSPPFQRAMLVMWICNAMAAGRMKVARTGYEAALKTCKDLAKALREISNGVEVVRGKMQLSKDAVALALLINQSLRKLAPNDAVVLRRLADLYLVGWQDEKALAMLDGIAEKERTIDDEHLRARVLARMKRWKESLAIYRALEKREDMKIDGDFLFFYGITAESAGETALALEKLRQAYKLSPDQPDIANSLGYILADHDMELENAQKMIEEALNQHPEQVSYLDSLAWVLYKRGDIPRALAVSATLLEHMDEKYRRRDGDECREIMGHIGKILQAAGCTDLWKFYGQVYLPAVAPAQ